jgi:ferrous iron transport protein A
MTHRTLDQLEPGQTAVVVSVAGPEAIARRLMELGIAPGTTVEMVRRAPLGDPLELRVRRVHLSIRHSEARYIHVDPA